jgi:hypothetical protein
MGFFNPGLTNFLLVISVIIVVAALAYATYLLVRPKKNVSPFINTRINTHVNTMSNTRESPPMPVTEPAFKQSTEYPAASPGEQQPPAAAEPVKEITIPIQTQPHPLQDNAEPQFIISQMEISPSLIKVGDQFFVSCIVTNKGTSGGSRTVALKINGELVSSYIIDMEAGATSKIVFSGTITQSGQYFIQVEHLQDSIIVH